MENSFSDLAVHYSSEELLIMVYQFDQWDDEMLAAIQHQLLLRNLFPDDVLEKRNKTIKREDEILSDGKEATFPQQFLGWVGILGVLGLIIGYDLAFAKAKSKYTGKEYWKYDEASRESGRYMFFISTAIVVGYLFYKIANYFERY